MNSCQSKISGHESLRMEMLRVLSGGWLSQCIYLVAKLGVADHFDVGRLSIDELASQCNVDDKILYRVMTALASCDIFVEYEHKFFATNDLGKLLASNHPYSLRSLAILYGVWPFYMVKAIIKLGVKF